MKNKRERMLSILLSIVPGNQKNDKQLVRFQEEVKLTDEKQAISN